MRIMNVHAFNVEARKQYDLAVEKWKAGKASAFPSLAMFLFLDPEGNELYEGYVATEPNRHIWGRTEKEAVKAFHA